MNSILKILKENNLKSKEFINFLNMKTSHFNYAINKNDEIYMKGMEIKLKEFIAWKIKQLQKALNNFN